VRFVVTGEWNRNQLLRLILLLFLVYVAFFWLTNWILWYTKMGVSPASVAAYFRGDPTAEFGQPARPLSAIAEQSHFHLFAMGVLVMTLTHLLLFLPVPVRVKGTLVVLTFCSALLDEGSSWLIRYLHPGFAWIKILAFLSLQGSLLGLLILLVRGVWRPGRHAHADGSGHQGSAAPRR
jgi:hypothetical protein